MQSVPTTRTPLFPPDWLVAFEYREEHLGVLRPGKEAEVHLYARSDATRTCFVAEKRFTPRDHRGFRNDGDYAGGWIIGARREARAMRAGTRKGRAMLESAWVSHEWDALVRFHAAGVTVPPPVELIENGYRMAFIGEDGVAAPRLSRMRLTPALARQLYEDLLLDVRLMLEADRVHGDLSEYNVLVWRDRPVVIDFSQSVDVITHPRAMELLRRDVTALCAFFARAGVRVDLDDALAQVGARREIFGGA